MPKNALKKQRVNTSNKFVTYSLLTLALASLFAGMFFDSYFGLLFYAMIIASLILSVIGIANKNKRINPERADQLLLISSVVLITSVVWTEIAQLTPINSRYHLYYANFWSGWPVLPLALILGVILLASKRQKHKKYVKVALLILAIGLIWHRPF